ncbi:MAG: type VI secretion system ImpA family N-terminal domain-containing protein [Myxococcales bacterium]|nr:type VI secretion system ImpA family N-terminal domain-containing protein [Myxococcales bacterium]
MHRGDVEDGSRGELLQREAATFLEAIAARPADDLYAQLDAEVAQDTAVRGGPVRWRRVAELGGEILRGVAKDLRVAVYTAFALYRTRGAEGLAIGLGVIDGLLERAWATLVPPRPRGRVQAIAWLLERLEQTTRDEQPRLLDVDGWRLVRALSERLEARVRARFGAQAPEFAGWRAALEWVERALAALLEAAGPGRGATSAAGRRGEREAAGGERRILEVGLPRRLIAQVGVPLHVLLRVPGTPSLLERLAAAEPPRSEGEAAWHDFPPAAGGEAVPLSVSVSLQGDDFRCADTRKRVRLGRGRDAPLLTFFVAPRRAGPVSVSVEVAIDGEVVVGGEQVWRVCVERGAAGEPAQAGFVCQSGALPGLYASAGAGGRAAEVALHALLCELFTPDELYRWMRLNFAAWSVEVPGAASVNEVAYAVVDSGARLGRLDEWFFEALAAQFPLQVERIAGVRRGFAGGGAA